MKAGHVGAIDDELWARTVYDIVAAARDRDDTEVLARALLPVYFARVAALIDEVKELDSAGAERHVEAQALAFERFKPSLVERWSASEPSRA